MKLILTCTIVRALNKVISKLYGFSFSFSLITDVCSLEPMCVNRGGREHNNNNKKTNKGNFSPAVIFHRWQYSGTFQNLCWHRETGKRFIMTVITYMGKALSCSGGVV